MIDLILEVIPRPPQVDSQGVPVLAKAGEKADKILLLSWKADNAMQFNVVMEAKDAEQLSEKLVLAVAAARGQRIIGADARGRPKA